MALTIGTDSYISLTDANTYLTTNGQQALDLSRGETLLRQATKAIDRTYAGRFIGVKTLSSQALYWPRFITDQYGFYQYNALGDLVQLSSQDIPVEVQEATAELALMLQQAGPTNPFDPYEQTAPTIKARSEKVGELAVSETFASSWTDKGNHWSKIDTILRPWLKSGAVTKMVRGA